MCTENSKADNQSYLFLTIQKSNFFTKLKNNSDGKVKYDITLDEKGVYNYTQKNDILEIYKEDKNVSKGVFSISNNNLYINLKGKSFKGKCQLYKDYCINNITH